MKSAARDGQVASKETELIHWPSLVLSSVIETTQENRHATDHSLS